MKPDYKNWVPKGMLLGVMAGTAAAGVLLLAFLMSDLFSGTTRTVVSVILTAAFLILLVTSILCVIWYRTFSYDGPRQFSRQVIQRIAAYIDLPQGGKGLDVGCGSGALTIACAKRNPDAAMLGVDRWGREYAAFTQPLCQSNAKIEGVSDNTSFQQADACHLPFGDGAFDAVTSNYCYHNIPSRNRQAIVLETLRVLKKGGTFAIHDIFSRGKYGDTKKLLQTLRDKGYEKVELLDTTNGLFMTKKECRTIMI